MKLTVLGKSPAWQDAGGACSGYLVEEGDTAVLVDCGNGVFGKLRERIDYVDVDGILISHLHADHFLDLVPYAYALSYAPRQQPVPVNGWPGTDEPARPALHAPPGRPGRVPAGGGRVGARGPDREGVRPARIRPRERGSGRLAGGALPAGPALHRDVRDGLQLSHGGGRLVYAADCSPTSALNGFASPAELMLVEATLPRPERTGSRGHLTPGEAGEQARAAGAKRLLLVHISDELDAGWARDQAAASFGGPVEVAREGDVYEV